MPRKLSSAAMVTAVAATPEQRDAINSRMAGIMPLVDIKQLERLTAEGFIDAVVIKVSGCSGYVVWYARTVDGGLHVNAVVQMDKAPGIEHLAAGLELLAKRHNASFIRFNTKRAGLLAIAETLGYTADSITLIKRF